MLLLKSYNFQRVLYTLKFGYLRGPAFAFTVVNSFDESSVVPVLDHVVRTVVDLDFNGVATIVNEEDDRFLTVTQHRGYVLARHLETSISNESQHSLVQ